MVLTAFFVFGVPHLQAWTTTRAKRRVPGSAPIRVRIDHDGVFSDNNGAGSRIAWSAVGDVIETDHLILIEIGRKGGAVVLPRRLLTPDQLESALWWLKTHVRQAPAEL